MTADAGGQRLDPWLPQDRWRPALLQWPAERRRLAHLRSLHLPVLLLVADGCAPPPVGDGEDWAMRSSSSADVEARMANLGVRVRRSLRLDGDILESLGGWVQLSPVQSRIVGRLLELPDLSAPRAELSAAIGLDAAGTDRRLQDALDRLRVRLRGVGLAVRTEAGHRAALALPVDDAEAIVTA